MGINALTARRLADQRRKEQIREAMKRTITVPVYYEVRSGIIDYRSGKWIREDNPYASLKKGNALQEFRYRCKHPTEGQNAVHIVRRYQHAYKDFTEAMEDIR